MLIKVIIILIAVVIVLYLLAIMPKLRHNPYCRKLDGWLYAHRGLHDNKSEAPENSLPAFMLAVQHGYGIELDVQLTKDKIPVVLHDYNLKRACNTDIKVSELNYEELLQYRLFKSQEKIPMFTEVLAAVDGRVPMIIELKIPWRPETLCEIVSDILKDYQGIYCIESFNPLGLKWYRRNYPDIVRGQLSTDFIKDKVEGSKFQYFILKHLLMNFYTKPDFIAYHHIYKKSLSYTLCRKLYRVKTAAWTIKSEKDYEENKKYFEWFIFDSFLPKAKSKEQ
jgi:glycerophosphoryl diester phosphodiesterase